MISETVFARRYTSFWQQLLPMADAIVRRINVSYERFAPALKSETPSHRRGYVNELGFRIFGSAAREQLVYPEPSTEQIDELARETAAFMERLQPQDVVLSHSLREREEALSLSRQLYHFLASQNIETSIQVGPRFPGCGILNTCVGDILARPTLYEVKAGARDFRLVDIRQVVTYCALNFDVQQYEIEEVVLLNPRLGIFARMAIHDDVARASGAPAAQAYTMMLDFLSQDPFPTDSERL